LATAEELVEAMNRDGVDRAVVMGLGWTGQQVAKEANDYLIQAAWDYPDRLTAFCSVNPAWGKAALKEVERCAAAGLKGIGELHPDSQRIDIADKKTMAPVMDLARSLDLPVLVHSSEPVGHLYPGKGNTTPEKLYKLITNFPDNVIICAHWGGGLPFYALMPEVPKALENVYFDSAASPFLYSPEVFTRVAELAGVEKVLFASDFPLMEPARSLKQVDGLEMPADDKRRILGENAARLLGL
jgi:predicted TIM-barrel fold metal-dependent hydrolase